MENQTNDPNPDFKLAVCLNKGIESGKLKNALAHAVAGLAAKVDESGRTALKFIDFTDAGGVVYPSISARSFIILRGSHGDLRKALNQARESGVSVFAFCESMTGGTYHDQLERTSQTKTEDMVHWAVALAGTADQVNPITKRFSLWRDASPVQRVSPA